MIQSEIDSSRYVFLFGISVRSGTNFSARIFSKHPEVEVVPNNETIREFPLLKVIDQFKDSFDAFSSMYTGNNGNKEHYTWRKYAAYFGDSFLKYIDNELVIDHSKKIYFMKDPGVKNIKFVSSVFPDSKVILLVRDGRDLVESSEKGYLVWRNSQSVLNRVKRYVFHYTGREFRRNVKAWLNNAKMISEFLATENGKKALLIRYEDLAAEIPETYAKLFEYCGLSIEKVNYKNVEVIGSSFSDQISENGENKIKWTPIEKTKKFKPVGRWKSWPKWKINYFNKVAGAYLKEFGYQ